MSETGLQKLKLTNLTFNKTNFQKEFYNEQYYLDVLVNNNISSKTPLLTFNNFTTSYDLDLEISFKDQLDTIIFKLLSQKNNIPLFQGSFSTLPSDLNKKGSFEYSCDIRNPKKEKISIDFIYTNNLINNDLPNSSSIKEKNSKEIFNNYEQYVEKIDKEKKEIQNTIKRVSASNNIKSEVSLLELAKGKNAILFNNFVRNVDYIKVGINFVLDFLYWKDPYKTFSLLSIITIFILYTNFFILILSILLLILFHLSYRDTMEETFSFKYTSRDYSSNFQVIMWIMELTNQSISSLENMFYQLQNNSKELFKEVYINLLKLLLWNIPLYFMITYFSNKIDTRYIQVFGLWFFFLMQYPPFKAFIMILGKLVVSLINDFINWRGKRNDSGLKNNEHLIRIAEIIIPFFNLGKEIYTKSAKNVLKQMNDAPEIVIIQDKNDENKLKQMLKYEIYEKQRWRIMNWSDDLKKEDGANWVKKGNNKNIFIDKNKLELPGNEYEWKNDWEIEISINTDKEGWEYAKNFDDNIWQNNDKNCSVRRRKWIKYAGLK
jgi:hypothetical protein